MSQKLNSLRCAALGFGLLFTTAFAQKSIPLHERVSTSSVFVMDTPNGYFTTIELQGHHLRVGDLVDGVDRAGHRLGFKVTAIRIENVTVDQLTTGNRGMIDLQLLTGKMSDFGGDYMLVDPGAPYPEETKLVEETIVDRPLTAQLGSQPWAATYGARGAHYYAQGNAAMESSGKPLLQLSFSALTNEDSRQLSIWVHDFAGKVGVVDEANVEVLLSGSADGKTEHRQSQDFKHKAPYKKYLFVFEITQWEATNNGTYLLSATFKGKLKGINGAPDIVINNGEIDRLEVQGSKGGN